MSGWEVFTWLNVGVLAIGSVVVFGLFLRVLPDLLPRRPPESGDRASTEAQRNSQPGDRI